MTNKQKIKLWANDRIAYGYDIDSDILNLTYRVITHYCRHIDIDDIGDIYSFGRLYKWRISWYFAIWLCYEPRIARQFGKRHGN